MKKLLLFDIDGTLVQMKMGQSKQIFISMLDEVFGIEADESNLPSFAGQTDLQILRDIAHRYNYPFEKIEKDIDKVWVKLLDFFKQYASPYYITLLPGVKKILDILEKDENYQLALLTGNFKANAFLKLGIYDLDRYFKFGAFGSDHENRSKLPEIAWERSKEHSTNGFYNAENSLIIGDSFRDISCARDNNMKVLALGSGGMSKEEATFLKADQYLSDMSDTDRTFQAINELFGIK